MSERNPFTGKYPCRLSPTGVCVYGGNKRFNYGFVSGTHAYCRKDKRSIFNPLTGETTVCPLAGKVKQS